MVSCKFKKEIPYSDQALKKNDPSLNMVSLWFTVFYNPQISVFCRNLFQVTLLVQYL